MPSRAPYDDAGGMTDSPATRLLLALAWFAVVSGALVLLGQGLAAGFQIENTEAAMTEAAHGARLVSIACGLLVLGAVLAMAATWPWWVAVGLLVPVAFCGGLTALASESLLPQLSVVVAYPAAVCAGFGGLVMLARRP